MEQSSEISELAAALSKAQGAMPNLVADQKASILTKKGYTYSYNYANLASVLEAIRKPFSENGLAIVQGLEADIDKITCTTQLCHTSGQWIRSQLSLFVDPKATPQEIGSAQSYARRYGLTGMVAVAAEDDDGKAASTGKQNTEAKRVAVDTETGEIKATVAPPPKVDEQQNLCPIHKVAWIAGKEDSLYHGPKDPDWCTPAKAYAPNLEAAWRASGLPGKCGEWIGKTYGKPWAKLSPEECEHAIAKLTAHIEGRALIFFELSPDDQGRGKAQDYKNLQSATPQKPTPIMYDGWSLLCAKAKELGIKYPVLTSEATYDQMTKAAQMLGAMVEAKESQAKEDDHIEV